MNEHLLKAVSIVWMSLSSSALLATVPEPQNHLTQHQLTKSVAKQLGSPLNTESAWTRSSYEPEFEVSVFSWNTGGVRPIELNHKQALESQFQQAASRYFELVAHLHGANKWSIGNSELNQFHDTGRGGMIARYVQQVDGIEVFGQFINILIDRKNRFVASSGYFSKVSKAPQSRFSRSESEALAIAFYQNTGTEIDNLRLKPTLRRPYSKLSEAVSNGDFVLTNNSRVKKVFFAETARKLLPAYYVEVETLTKDEQSSTWYSYVIDADSGKVLFKNNLTAHVTTTYRVFAEIDGLFTPFDGPHGNNFTPHPTGEIDDTPAIGEIYTGSNTVTLNHGPISTQDPWLGDMATVTTGNNVDAYADVSGSDGFDAQDIRPEMTGPNAFEYEFATFSDGTLGQGQKYSVVNLFFVNNFLHDWFYDNGFDELAGNAQANNYGRGGAQGDAMNVEAQDFSGVNNANMSTPSDGASPRMQMYLWDILDESSVEVNGVTDIEVGTAAFGPDEFDEMGILTLTNDGTAPLNDGCEIIPANLSGRVAIIDRGSCNFVVKVKNAQDAGASAVIIVNNAAADEDGGGVITMGGEDETINIASLFVSLEKGEEIKTALVNDSTLEGRLINVNRPLDGTIDNAIVAHEWGHYLSNRLVGDANGLFNQQGRSLGEGWSDFIALLMTVKESDNLIAGNENYQGVYSASTFVGDAYYGIRRVPYSTDMNKNALTFKHIENGVQLPLSHPVAYGLNGSNNSEVHNSGEVWASVLWDIFVSLINKPAYDFEQAREMMKDYLVAGLKMTPNGPTVLDARNAMLAVASSNNIEDFKLMRDAFARRGFGASSQGPDRLSATHAGVVEDFSTGSDVLSSIDFDSAVLSTNSCDNDGIWDAGETLDLTLHFTSFAAEALPTFSVNLSSSDEVTFSNSLVQVNPINAFGDSESESFEVTLNDSRFMQNLEITASVTEIGAAPDDFVEPAPVSITLVTNVDFNAINNHDDMSSILASQNDWQIELTKEELLEFQIVNGRWYAPDSGAAGSSSLITPEIKVSGIGETRVSFEHYFQFETSADPDGVVQNWDGGVIEVSVEGGDWIDVVDFGGSLSDPYNGTIADFSSDIAGRRAYVSSGNGSSDELQSNTVTFPEGLVNGQNIRLRFRIVTDSSVGDYGWEIDNVLVSNSLEPVFSELVVEDNHCFSGVAPVVSAGSDIVIVPTNSTDININLVGTVSDADNDSLMLAWLQRSGPDVTINNASSASANFTIAAPSERVEMIFELSASDSTFNVTDRVKVMINVNTLPLVTATGNSTNEGQVVLLTATANDPDGDNLSYSWSQTAGPSITLDSASTFNPSFVAPQVDSDTTLTFEVIVSDGIAESSPARVSVTVFDVSESQSRSGGGTLAWLYITFLGSLGIYRIRSRKVVSI